MRTQETQQAASLQNGQGKMGGAGEERRNRVQLLGIRSRIPYPQFSGFAQRWRSLAVS
jgi:hypothetical protein